MIVGETQPPIVHALAHALNQTLGNVGQTVTYTEPLEVEAGTQSQSLPQLVAEMRSGQAHALVMLDCNPIYTSPADLDFASALAQLPFAVHMGEYVDETANLSLWHVPQSHYLESWGDVRAHDGTITLQQPLLAPLYQSRSPYELLSVLTGQQDRSNHDILRDRWKRYYQGKVTAPSAFAQPPLTQDSPATDAKMHVATAAQSRSKVDQRLMQGAGDTLTPPTSGQNTDSDVTQNGVDDFDLYWRTILNDGVIPNTAAPVKSVAILPTFTTNLEAASGLPISLADAHGAPASHPTTLDTQLLDLVFTPDPTIWDGRFSNNGWLQELPKPLTKLTWDNAACISPRLAQDRKTH